MSLIVEEGEWCDQCQLHHQPRERRILCIRCHRNGTESYHGICSQCEAR